MEWGNTMLKHHKSEQLRSEIKLGMGGRVSQNNKSKETAKKHLASKEKNTRIYIFNSKLGKLYN